MITVDAVRTAVHTSMPTIVSDLTDLVAIPSVSASSHDQSQVQRSAEAVAALLRDSGLDAEILSVPAPDGTPGRPAGPAPGLSTQEPPAAINLPSAGILLFVVVTAYRRRRPETQPVLVSTQEAPLAEIGANLPQ